MLSFSYALVLYFRDSYRTILEFSRVVYKPGLSLVVALNAQKLPYDQFSLYFSHASFPLGCLVLTITIYFKSWTCIISNISNVSHNSYHMEECKNKTFLTPPDIYGIALLPLLCRNMKGQHGRWHEYIAVYRKLQP